MYRLATMHSVTDQRTDRRLYDANGRSYCVQYDRLKYLQRLSVKSVFCGQLSPEVASISVDNSVDNNWPLTLQSHWPIPCLQSPGLLQQRSAVSAKYTCTNAPTTSKFDNVTCIVRDDLPWLPVRQPISLDGNWSHIAVVLLVLVGATLFEKAYSPVHTVAEKCNCRRKRRDNGDSRRIRWQSSPNSATVALFGDKLSHFSATVWTGFKAPSFQIEPGSNLPETIFTKIRINNSNCLILWALHFLFRSLHIGYLLDRIQDIIPEQNVPRTKWPTTESPWKYVDFL